MKSNHLLRKPKLLRASLILLFMAAPIQWAAAQFTLSTSQTTLGQVIKTVQKQSKYQFFYDDQLSGTPIASVNVKDATLEELLNAALKGKNVTYKIEDNVVYLSKGNNGAQAVKQDPVERNISGTVVDTNGEPLIGVNVSVKGTTTGTITDFDGNYTLKVTEANPVIVYSYIGYKSQNLALGDKNVLNVTLSEDTQIIDEVVVTALGIKREKKMLGYAVQELKSDQLNKTGDPSVTSALQGKVAGL